MADITADEKRAARLETERLKAQEGQKAMQEYRDEQAATAAKTVRLRALRLAKEAEDAKAKAEAKALKASAPKKKTATKKAAVTK
jgi:membrane protein involved in colicin uptake